MAEIIFVVLIALAVMFAVLLVTNLIHSGGDPVFYWFLAPIAVVLIAAMFTNFQIQSNNFEASNPEKLEDEEFDMLYKADYEGRWCLGTKSDEGVVDFGESPDGQIQKFNIIYCEQTSNVEG